jgi:hypothetical protein
MLTCSKLIPQGHGLAAVLLKRAATVELDWDVRQKSRFDATDSLGRTLGVFLPRGTTVRGGDVLVAESNSPAREEKGVTAWVAKMMMKRAGAGVPSANRITLLRAECMNGLGPQLFQKVYFNLNAASARRNIDIRGGEHDNVREHKTC